MNLERGQGDQLFKNPCHHFRRTQWPNNTLAHAYVHLHIHVCAHVDDFKFQEDPDDLLFQFSESDEDSDSGDDAGTGDEGGDEESCFGFEDDIADADADNNVGDVHDAKQSMLSEPGNVLTVNMDEGATDAANESLMNKLIGMDDDDGKENEERERVLALHRLRERQQNGAVPSVPKNVRAHFRIFICSSSLSSLVTFSVLSVQYWLRRE